MNEKIKIVDTTLRDGEQRPGISFSMEEKLKMARILDECGISEIEAGTSAEEWEGKDYFNELRKCVKKAKISVWSRLETEDIKKAIACKPDIIHIGVPVSYVQIYSKLKKNKVWLHRQICETIEIIRSHNIDITVGFEDASRADEGFILETAKLVKELGGNMIRIADTVGVLTPGRTFRIINQISSRLDINIEFHGHNDLGMAVANSIVAAKAGAAFLDCTLFGIGERSGNCNFREFVEAASWSFDLGIKKNIMDSAEKLLLEIMQNICCI